MPSGWPRLSPHPAEVSGVGAGRPVGMAIAERIQSYSAWVGQTNYLTWTRTIRLELEFGSTAYLAFPETRPTPWLQSGDGYLNAWLTADQFDDVHHLLQTEQPVFLTAVDAFGLQVVAVHTELDLARGEPTGEGYVDTSLEAVVVRARREQDHSADA